MLPDWEFWLDNHISPIIAKWLKDELGWNIKSAYTLNTEEMSDQQFYHKAKLRGNVIIISKDSDLDQIITLSGAPPKLIMLKVGNCDNKLLFSILKNQLQKVVRFLFDFDKNIVEIFHYE